MKPFVSIMMYFKIIYIESDRIDEAFVLKIAISRVTEYHCKRHMMSGL